MEDFHAHSYKYREGERGWLNSPALTAAGLRGKVPRRRVLDVHLHQLLRSLPYVRAW